MTEIARIHEDERDLLSVVIHALAEDDRAVSLSWDDEMLVIAVAPTHVQQFSFPGARIEPTKAGGFRVFMADVKPDEWAPIGTLADEPNAFDTEQVDA